MPTIRRLWVFYTSEAFMSIHSLAEGLYEALKMAVEVLRDNDIDESMAGEFEILTDALEAYERRNE